MKDAPLDSGFISSRPRISLDGVSAPDLETNLLSLEVEEVSTGLHRCRATFDSRSLDGKKKFQYMDRDTLDFGVSLAVYIEDQGPKTLLFEGRIVGIEAAFPEGGNTSLSVIADNKLQDFRTTPHTRTFETTSDSQIFAQIAATHNLSPDIQVSGPVYDVITQLNQSDWAFLHERAAAIDAEFWVEHGVLHVVSRADRGSEVLSLKYGQDLRAFEVLADTSDQYTSTWVTGWDDDAKAVIASEADEAALGGELGGDQSASTIVQQAFGERPNRLVHFNPSNLSEASSQAASRFRTMARRFVRGRGVSDGHASLRVGVTVNLGGLGNLFGGLYYVARVLHSFTITAGYRTEFYVERPTVKHPKPLSKRKSL